MTPVVCLITDRRRTDAGDDDAVVALVGRAARAGVHLIQVRERDLDGGPLLRLVRRCVEASRGTGARVIVNDRLDVALAAGAHGVHLRERSMPAPRVRAIAPREFLVGRSVHGAAEAAAVSAAGGLDYLLFGTVFETPSKHGRQAAGAAALARAVAATPLPVIAVGGIGLDRMLEVGATGAAGVAAIGLFAEAPATDTALDDLLAAGRAAFAAGRAAALREP